MVSRRSSRRAQLAAVAVALMLQLGGMVVLFMAALAGSDFCMETGSCSEGSRVWGIVLGAVGVVVLYGGFATGARRAKLDRPLLTGLVAFVVGWGGGVQVAALAGRRPLVGVVFVVGTLFVMVAERRGPALAATAAATLVMALKEDAGRGTGSGMVAVTLTVFVALIILVPQGQPPRPAEDRTAT